MAGTYSYLKVAKMKLIDGSSNLVITANDSSGVALASNRLTAGTLKLPSTAALHWNDPRNPVPNNNRSILDSSGNISTINVTAGNLSVTGGVTASSFSGGKILLGSSSLVDLSGNVNTNELVVGGNVNMVADINITGGIYTGGNASVNQSISVLQNKSIAKSVFIGNALQMLDSSGANVFLTGAQLKLLLALI